MADQEAKEFDTNVADADERKRIRAQRIEARRDAEKGALDKANEERKAAERSQGKQQIAESLSHLDKKKSCLLYTSPSPRDKRQSRMPSSA